MDFETVLQVIVVEPSSSFRPVSGDLNISQFSVVILRDNRSKIV